MVNAQLQCPTTVTHDVFGQYWRAGGCHWVAYCFIPAIEEGLEDRRERKKVDAAMKKFKEEHYWDPNAGYGGEWRRKDGKPMPFSLEHEAEFAEYENRVRG